jgi:hypothetical protein
MSTENTQNAENPSAGSSVESTTNQTTLGESSQPSAAPDTSGASLDGLRKLAKDSEAQEGPFTPKPVDEAMKAAVIPAPNAYTSNYKYQALLQEKEIDEFWRPLIKDKDSEKKVIDLLTRADGLDHVKTSRERLSQEYQSLANDYKEKDAIIQRVESSLNRGDLSSVFRQLGVTPEHVFKWTQQKLQEMELPPEQRRAFEEAENLRSQQYDVQEQMAQYQRMYEDQAVQARTVHLDLVLSRAEVSKAAEGWDQLMGQQGAFRDLVIQEAQNAFSQRGQDLSAEQAVQHVMAKYGRAFNQQSQQGLPSPEATNAPQMQMQSQSAHQVHTPQAKPVIPNINGKGAAPIKKVPKSLDDLKKIAKELQAEG